MLEELIKNSVEEINVVESSKDLQKLKVKFLGKSSFVNLERSKIGSLPQGERSNFGKILNEATNTLSEAIEKKFNQLQEKELSSKLEKERLDLTIPARKRQNGSIHPTSQSLEEIIQIFSGLGLHIKDGPNIEEDWYNFTALNIEENHPARQMHDTFYLKSEGKLLRTHTSPVQIRTLQSEKPPFRFIAPGRTYRSDYDLTHTPMFHQIEGMVIDKNINMGHLKYVIIELIHKFFERENIDVQFRPSFFPFTEPSAEVDIRMNKNDKWLEVLGCGMVHPKVLKNVGIDPDEYQGFAFGLGLERFAMLKYGIKDLRKFFEGDVRWLRNYSFESFDIPTFAGGLTR